MKRLLLSSLGVFLVVELLGNLLSSWLGFHYLFQKGIIYALLFFVGGWTYYREKRLLYAWLIGIPMALLHLNFGGPLAEALGHVVHPRDLPPQNLLIRLLDTVVRPSAMALWSLLGGLLYKVFAMEDSSRSKLSE